MVVRCADGMAASCPNDRKLRDTILAIIVEKTHPDLKLILARFDELAAFLKKPIT